MSFKKRLLEKYNLVEDRPRSTPLRKYIRYIGMDWTEMNRKQIDKIARTQAYKQYKGLRKIKKIIDKNQADLEEAKNIKPMDYEFSQPAHATKKQVIVDLINKGYSSHYKMSKSKSGSPKHRGFKAQKVKSKKFAKDIAGHGTKTRTLRLPKSSEIHGKYLRTMVDDVQIDTNILEGENMSQVDKLLNKSKEMKAKEQNQNDTPQDFEIQKTMTGNSANTNTIEINPTVTASTRLHNVV
nr:MAG: hypothetical protein [Caudoviricetes sp.]